MTRLLLWIGLAGAIAYLVFIGGAWTGIYLSPVRTVSMAIVAAVLIGWLIVAVREPGWRPRTVLLPTILAALGSLGLSTLFSQAPRVSLEYLGYAVMLAALYLLLVRLMAHPFYGPRITTLCALLSSVIATLFVLRVVAHWIDWWALLGRLAIPPLRPNYEGLTYFNPSGVLTMVTLLAVPAFAWLGGSSRATWATGLIALAIGMVAILSGSRAGWLALAGTVLLGLIAVALQPRWRAHAGARIGFILAHPPARVAVGLAGLGMLGLAALLAPVVLLRLTEGGETLRLTFSLTAIRMFLESPIAGSGPGTWVIRRTSETRVDEPDYYIPHTHNIETQTLGELGLVGALAGVVVLLSVARLLLDGLRDASDLRRRWAIGGTLALLYFVLHQQLDFYANMPAAIFAAAIPVAYLDATASPRSAWRLPSGLRRAGTALGAVLVVVACIGLLVQELPASQYEASVTAANRQDWTQASSLAEGAVATDPDVGAHQFMAGLASAHTGDHVRAAAAFERVALKDDLPEAWLNLAAERAMLGDRAGALEAVGAALRLGRQRPAVAVPAGQLALELGDKELAVTAFGWAIGTTPSLAADPWWHETAARTQAYEDAIDLALATAAPAARWEITLMRGDAGAALALAPATGFGELAAQVTAAWEGDRSAYRDLLASCHARPTDLTLLNWCARLDRRSGDIDAAARWNALAEVVVGGASQYGAELRVAGPDDAGSRAGSPAVFWSTFTYRRPGPDDLLVPSLVHLTLR